MTSATATEARDVADFDLATAQFERIRAGLEAVALGHFIAIDETGRYSLGKTRREAIDAFKAQHGGGRIVTFRVGR